MLTYKYLKYKNKYINKKNKINNNKLNLVGGDDTLKDDTFKDGNFKFEELKCWNKTLLSCQLPCQFYYDTDVTKIISLENIPSIIPLPNMKKKKNTFIDEIKDKSTKLYLLLMTLQITNTEMINCETITSLIQQEKECNNFDIYEESDFIIISFKGATQIVNFNSSQQREFVNLAISQEMSEFELSENFDLNTILSYLNFLSNINFSSNNFTSFMDTIIDKFVNISKNIESHTKSTKTYLSKAMTILKNFLRTNKYKLFKLLIQSMLEGKKIYLVGHSLGGISALYLHIILQFLFNYKYLETYIFGGFPIIPNHLKEELTNVFYIINENDPLCEINIISSNNYFFSLVSLPKKENTFGLLLSDKLKENYDPTDNIMIHRLSYNAYYVSHFLYNLRTTHRGYYYENKLRKIILQSKYINYEKDYFDFDFFNNFYSDYNSTYNDLQILLKLAMLLIKNTLLLLFLNKIINQQLIFRFIFNKPPTKIEIEKLDEIIKLIMSIDEIYKSDTLILTLSSIQAKKIFTSKEQQNKKITYFPSLNIPFNSADSSNFSIIDSGNSGESSGSGNSGESSGSASHASGTVISMSGETSGAVSQSASHSASHGSGAVIGTSGETSGAVSHSASASASASAS